MHFLSFHIVQVCCVVFVMMISLCNHLFTLIDGMSSCGSEISTLPPISRAPGAWPNYCMGYSSKRLVCIRHSGQPQAESSRVPYDTSSTN